MTYNIQHGLDYVEYKKIKQDIIDMNLTATVINEADADIICLNEVRGKGKHPVFMEQAEIMGEKTNRNFVFSKCIEFPNLGPYGDALLARYPITNYEIIDIPDPQVKDEDVYYETRKLLKVEFELEKKITVFISHFGLAKAEQRNAVEVLLKEIKKVNTPVIFMGDLNITPDNEIIQPIYAVLKEVYTTGGPLTWPSHAPEIKIDYIFVSRDITVNNVITLEKVVSDHFPIVAEIEL